MVGCQNRKKLFKLSPGSTTSGDDGKLASSAGTQYYIWWRWQACILRRHTASLQGSKSRIPRRVAFHPHLPVWQVYCQSVYMQWMTHTAHSSTPKLLKAHQRTFLGTRSKAFSRSTKAKGFLGQMWHLIVSTPDLCRIPYLYSTYYIFKGTRLHRLIQLTISLRESGFIDLFNLLYLWGNHQAFHKLHRQYHWSFSVCYSFLNPCLLLWLLLHKPDRK